jgi:glycosyltransferase Alg8
MWLSVYILALAALALHAPDLLWQAQVGDFLIILAVLGAWRYGWGAVHLGRALWYRHVVFPRWRRAADLSGAAGAAAHVYIVIATSRIGAETTARVYQAAIAEAIRYARPATIVAGVGELADQRWIQRAFLQMKPPPEIRLAFVRQPAIGRRHLIACSLRAVSRLRPPRDAAVVLLDGDVLLTAGSLTQALPFLKLMPEVDAIVSDEESIVAGGALMQAWHGLRVAQRHQTMSSLGLSRRLAWSSGGMSIHPAAVATDPDFIAALEHGDLEHGRHGHDHRSTGQDRSTWLRLLRRGRRMLYLPDVRTVTIEHAPARRLLPATTRAMLGGSDKMPGGSSTAIALGPGRIGLFTWSFLVERRVSLWTPLIGLVVALLFALGQSVLFLYAYLLWVGATRLLHALLLLTARPAISGLYPPLIYFGQIYGALIEAHRLARLGLQLWPRQPRTERPFLRWRAPRPTLRPAPLDALTLGLLIVAAAFGIWSLRLLPPL